MKPSVTVLGLFACTAFAAAAARAAPADSAPPGASGLADYQGKDRQERLISAAKTEGSSLTFYTTFAESDLAALTKPFEDKYGIRVNVWRSGTDNVLHRTVAEAAARRYTVDVIHFGAPEMEALHREKILLAVQSPAYASLRPGSVPDHHEWAATLLSVFVQAYNVNAVNKADLPKRFQDLLDPRWHGKLGVESKGWEWFATTVWQLGGYPCLKLFHDIVASNGVSPRYGHALLNNLVVSGEVPLALNLYNYMPEQAKRKGAPIDWFVLQPAVARANAVGVARHAPHPAAAVLFEDYMLTDAQAIIASMDYVPAAANIPSPLKDLELTLVDPVQALDQISTWRREFDDTFLKR